MKKGSVDRRSRGRERRELRADGAQYRRRSARRPHHRLRGSAEPPGADRQPPLRQQPRPPARGHGRDRRSSGSISRTRSSATRWSSTTARSRGRRRGPKRRRRRRPKLPRGSCRSRPPKPAEKSPVLAGRCRPRWRRGGDRARLRRAAGVPLAPDGLRAGLRRWLAGGVERHAGAAHAAHERHQCDQRHHRDRRHAAVERRRRSLASWARRRGDAPVHDQHRRRIPGDPSDVARCSAARLAHA